MMKIQVVNKAASQKGFTLVELVIVIAVLGVLAAVALPRFASLQTEARVAKANALGGSLRVAAANVRALALARGISCEGAIPFTYSPVTLESVPIALQNCYPASPSTASAPANSIIDAANIVPVNDLVTLSITGTSTINVQINGATTLANCRASYTPPNAPNVAPVFEVVTTGC